MDGNTLIELIQNTSPIIQSSLSAVVGAVMTTLFLKKNTEKIEFEKIKSGQFKEVANSLLDNGKMTYYEYYKCNNFLRIAELADEANEEEANFIHQGFDFDWYIRFFDAASSISNEDMQYFWSQILKGEVSQRGTFSLRAIETMWNMSQNEAEIFSNTTDVILDDAKIFSLLNNIGQEVNEKYGFNNDVLRLLEECGVLNGLKMVNQLTLDPNEAGGFEQNGKLLLFKNITLENITLNYSCYQLTKAGIELYPVVYKPKEDNNYLIDLGKEIQKNCNFLQVSVHPILESKTDDESVSYNEFVDLMK